MRVLSLSELESISFSVERISSLTFLWSDQCVNDYLDAGREHNLIFFQEGGSREYAFSRDGAHFFMPEKSMIFISHGAHYRTRALSAPSGDSRGYNALFDLYDSRGELLQIAEPFVMDDTPECAPCLSLFMSLNHHFHSYPPQHLRAVSDILQILDCFCRSLERRSPAPGAPDKSILPALNRIQESLESECPIRELCGLCHMSESTFRRRFRSQTGLSPVAFRNLLRVRKAKLIYDQSLGSVEEIAEQLGFCDGAYLCRTYKKLTGKTFSERDD